MKIVLATVTGQQFVVDVSPDEEVRNVKVLAEAKTRIPQNQMQLFWNTLELSPTARLSSYGVRDGSVVQVKQTATPGIDINSLASTINASLRKFAPPPPQQPVMSRPPPVQIPDPETYRASVVSDPTLLHQLLHNDKQLAEAVLSEDITLLRELLIQRAIVKQQEQAKIDEEARKLNENPFDPRTQALIEEKIREENVHDNMEHAMEYHPESFGRIVMLYVNAVVNGVPIKAFVDSGAQQTIMSEECAKRCNIMRLIDRRWSGIAQGVGTAKILGRVHSAPIKLGNSFFHCSFTILEGQNLEFLLGLDMLRRHQAILDLKSNALRIQEEVVPFLSESEIPDNLRSSQKLGDDMNVEPANNNNNTNTNKPASQPQNTTTQPQNTTTQPQNATTQPQNATTNPQNITAVENAIKTLMDLGNTRQEAIEALTVSNGNVDLAASYLFEKKLY